MTRRQIGLLAAAIIMLSGCAADVKTTLDSGQRIVEPLENALTSYHAKHGTYPTNLEALVAERLIEAVPQLPKKRGTLDVWPLRYQVSPDGSFYYLRFAYDFPGGFGPAEIITRYKISYEPAWGTRKYPPQFDDLVGQRAGARFRETGSADALTLAVRSLIDGAMRGTNCVNLYRVLITNALGQGTSVAVSPEINTAIHNGVLYESADHTAKYCFTYMPMNSNILVTKSHFTQDPFVADVVYTIRTMEDGESWLVLQQCR
jgi:hypothetical protein